MPFADERKGSIQICALSSPALTVENGCVKRADGDKPGIAEDEVVEKAHLSNLGEGDKPFGEREIRLAGHGIAGWMVVRNHNGDRAPPNRLLEDVAGKSRGGIRRTCLLYTSPSPRD